MKKTRITTPCEFTSTMSKNHHYENVAAQLAFAIDSLTHETKAKDANHYVINTGFGDLMLVHHNSNPVPLQYDLLHSVIVDIIKVDSFNQALLYTSNLFLVEQSD